ncbi:MAG: hypothetical protein ACLUE1_01430 [Adlercreutzia equolifaciens]
MTNVILTSHVTKGKMYATPPEHHIRHRLRRARAGRPDLHPVRERPHRRRAPHDHVSTETNVLTGMLLFPEVRTTSSGHHRGCSRSRVRVRQGI